ncbi:hypothetical protein KP509_12G037300 [Ceratopteris richardii]|uniref:Uncharacterized protein n=1 Tax=Ceratopteris richardii TaxID=49495 RepID=A0A8T2TNS0_CERRI|nr:hypothetical protein KP509_12G037300 [Ceratopteris richardii]
MIVFTFHIAFFAETNALVSTVISPRYTSSTVECQGKNQR